MADNHLSVKAPMPVTRKYEPVYIKYGFIIADCDAKLKAQSIACGETCGKVKEG